jgi:hypothetical protein
MRAESSQCCTSRRILRREAATTSSEALGHALRDVLGMRVLLGTSSEESDIDLICKPQAAGPPGRTFRRIVSCVRRKVCNYSLQPSVAPSD